MRRRLLFLPLVLCLAAAPAARAQTATLLSDTHVNSAQPAVNSGALSNLNVGNGYTALLQFDLSLLPPSLTAAQVTRAILRLYCNRADQPGSIAVSPLAGAWGEYSVTASTAPPTGSAIATAQVSGTGAYIAIDVTNLVQAWITTPASNFGLALTSSSAVVQFDSKENDQTAHPATLELDLALGAAGPQGPTGATGPQGLIGPAGPAGIAGSPGPMGPIGITGATGAAGPQGLPGAPGLQGPAGPQGIPGPQGPAGLNGANGATGAQGPIGPAGTGAQGPQGIQGPIGPTGPAGLQGAQGPRGGDGAQGLAGPQGPTGAIGPTGLTGLTGPPGPTGAQGSQGIQGPIGPIGINFRSGWSSAINYNANDAVTYNGSTYLAQASNQNLEPDLFPGDWTILALGGVPGPTGAQGPAGLNGANGATGAQGPQGPQGQQGGQGAVGPAGPQGATGVTGAQGLTGLNGATGPTGPTGAQGIQGATGPIGINFRSGWSSAINYNPNDAVTYNGSTYLAQASNQNLEPDLYPGDWTILALGGVPGATGAQGPAGLNGAAGATGAQGPQGPQGQQGGQGSVGPAGPAGATGATGPAGATGLTGPAGPTGPTGAQGAQGATGPIGINFRYGWTTGTQYSANDAVTWSGSTYLAQASNTNLEPDLYPGDWTVLAQAGSAGPNGPAGATPTIAIGTVTTGSPGTQAAVTNSGSSTAAILNFTIPQGATGATGSGGSGGSGSSSGVTTGIPFASTYHAVSFNFSNYAVNSQLSSNSESGSVLTWVPEACTITRFYVYSQQSNSITVTLRQGTPGSMASTAMSCIAATNSSCSATGSVAITAGNFVDIAISGANGTASPVWTAFGCDAAQ